MNEYKMEDAYLKHPYKGSELGFIFEKESEHVGNRGEELVKGRMTIVDPDRKLQFLLEGVSPNRDPRRWVVMSDVVCVQKEKLNDAYHIVHQFIQKMRPVVEEVENKDGTYSQYIHKLY